MRVLPGGLACLPGGGGILPLQVLELHEELVSLVMANQQEEADSIQSWQMAWLL